MQVKTADNLCVICGNVIPEGRHACPNCEAQANSVTAPTEEINLTFEATKEWDLVQQAFRQGFEEGMKTACGLKQENARLKKDIAILRAAIERRDSESNQDGWYE